ncbi:cyclic nucleotide-gated cation channel alpha-3 [Lasius niger]|uniref:Cyclic nucleotide-gated cation channel alpha-3 n=1 Tax=Lasius niger TaxID=67767 RepID=A0A0J7L2Q9_LASNI|nr:cyclic nucleotide-gated cation channel alpha-3 [Lasius niger]
MSSGAKRLVQSLRGRSGGGRGTGGGRADVAGDDGGVGVGGASTSATRLFHYDSGHELDEISVIGAAVRGNEGLTTPTTPCHCRSIKYGSGQTLCSIPGLPPVPPLPAHRAQSGEYDTE